MWLLNIIFDTNQTGHPVGNVWFRACTGLESIAIACSRGRMTMRRGPCGSSTCIGRCCCRAVLLTLLRVRRGSDMVVGSAGVRGWPGVIYGAVSSSIVCHTRAKMRVLSLVWHAIRDLSHGSR